MTFRVGQKVVCVKAGMLPGQERMIWDPGEELEEGKIYTIHSTFFSETFGIALVRLAETKRSARTKLKWGHDGYGAMRFRPAVERKTDISVLQALLVPGAKIKEPA